MLQLRNVNKIYGSGEKSVHALKNVNIDFPDHGLIFVVGKSGSGKSTLLNLLGGLDKMSSGEIVIDGFSTSHFTSNDFNSFRNFYIGFIFQEFNLIEEMNVYQNIATVLKIQEKVHNHTNIDDVLKMVGLEGLGYRKPNELSGGQRQRIAIARALVKNPKIILADEPTGALDSKTGQDLILSLKNLAREKLVIVVSHDREMANEYADQIFELSDGEIIRCLTLKDKANQIGMIGDGVLRIPANTTLDDPEIFNSQFAADQENYLCINTEPDRVALAYNDTFEYLYNRSNQADKYREETPQLSEVRYEKKKLKRAHIHFKELVSMARQSIKRKRKRLSILTLFSSFTMCFLIVALNVATISTKSVTILGVKESPLPMVTFTAENRSYISYGTQTISDNVFANLDAGGVDYFKVFQYSSYFYQADNTNQKNYITGFAEVKNFADTGMKLLAGSADLTSGVRPRIIITDYLANDMVNNGYIGLNKDGQKEAFFPRNYHDLIGTSVYFTTFYGVGVDALAIEIAGIAQSNYQDINQNSLYQFISPFLKLAFCLEGIKQKFVGVTYSAFNDLARAIDVPKTLFTGLPGATVLAGEIGDNLPADQIIVTKEWVSLLLGKSLDSLTSSDYSKVIGYETVCGVIVDYSYYDQRVRVSAVVDEPGLNIYYSKDLVNKFLMPTSILVPQNTPKIGAKVGILMDNELYFQSGSYSEIRGLDHEIYAISQVFNILSLIFGLLGFLITLNFISSSIKERKKEIGILRATGARSSDVFNIFLAEIFFLSLQIWIVSSLWGWGVVSLIGTGINVMAGLRVMTFDILDVVLLWVLSFIFLFISASLPIIRIVRQRPIDSIKRE